MTLHQLINPGRYRDYLYCYTKHYYAGYFGGIYRSGVLGLGGDILASKDKTIVVISSPTLVK